MKSLLALCFSTALALSAAHAVSDPATPTPKRTILNRVLHPFGSGEKKAKTAGKLIVEMKLEPQPLKLSSANRLKVTLTLVNRTKKLVPLEFPTAQRIEVLLKTASGKLVEQWSQDQVFAQETTVVTVNPGERVEYVVEVATRDLVAGQSYLVQGFFPNYDLLKAEKTIVPEK